MKKAKGFFAVMLSFVLAMSGLVGCTTKRNDEQAQTGSQSNEERRTIKLPTGEVSLVLPDNWEITLSEGTYIPYTEQTFDITLVSPVGVKAFAIFTIGRTTTGRPYDEADFQSLYTYFFERLLPYAVEKDFEIVNVDVEDGMAVYSKFTDAQLVDTTPPDDDYLYIVEYFASYNKGYIVYASIQTDDLSSSSYQVMLDAIVSIQASFGSSGGLTEADWSVVLSAPEYDLVSLSLYNNNLASTSYLKDYELVSTDNGLIYLVPVTTSGHLYSSEPGAFVWQAEGIGLLYYVVSDTDILEYLNDYVLYDISRLSSNLSLSADSPLRMSADRHSAAFVMRVDLQDKPNAIYIYLLQDVSDSNDLIMLHIMIFPDDWNSVSDPAILNELSLQLGIDLANYANW